jgi:ABC-type phosphate transport system substrate-binding protein
VARDRHAIACIALSYLTTARGTIKGVAVDGVAPTLRNAAAGRYRYLNALWFVTKGEPGGAVAEYINWIRLKHVQCTLIAKYVLPLGRC